MAQVTHTTTGTGAAGVSGATAGVELSMATSATTTSLASWGMRQYNAPTHHRRSTGQSLGVMLLGASTNIAGIQDTLDTLCPTGVMAGRSESPMESTKPDPLWRIPSLHYPSIYAVALDP